MIRRNAMSVASMGKRGTDGFGFRRSSIAFGPCSSLFAPCDADRLSDINRVDSGPIDICEIIPFIYNEFPFKSKEEIWLACLMSLSTFCLKLAMSPP